MILMFFLGFVALAAWGIYPHEQRKVESDFLKEHPTYKVISVGSPDGNDTTYVTTFIRYKKPGGEREYWSDWTYDTKDGKFVFVSQGAEHIYSEKAGQ